MNRGAMTVALEEATYASWGRRALAVLIDLALVMGSVVGLYLFAWAVVYLPLFLLGPPMYFWLMIGRYGCTLGKRAVRIVVRRSDDLAPVGYGRVLGRVAAWGLLAWFVVPLLLSVLWPIWDPRNQTLVDKIASTLVLRA